MQRSMSQLQDENSYLKTQLMKSGSSNNLMLNFLKSHQNQGKEERGDNYS